jgi:hypothetical protein
MTLEKLEINKKENAVTELQFVELTRRQFLGNEYILNKYFTNAQGRPCAYANDLKLSAEADTPYAKGKILKKDFGCKVSMKGYKYNEQHYIYSSEFLQDEHDEESFKYVEKEYNEFKEGLDTEAVDNLFAVLLKAIQQRLVIILDLEHVPGLINNALECSAVGVNCSSHNYSIRAKLNEIISILTNPEFVEWRKAGNSDLSLLTDENYVTYARDYISTYIRTLRNITAIRDMPLDSMKDIIHNDADYLEKFILENEGVIDDEEMPYYRIDLSEEDE